MEIHYIFIKIFSVKHVRKFTLLFLILAFFSGPTETIAQDLKGNNWFFGNSREAIRFNRADDAPYLLRNQGVPFGTGGSAVATDPVTGNLLFYTDGGVVYDASHRIMSNGTNLGAQTDINQPVAISPVPDRLGQYYIFSNLPGTEIRASIVDMNLPGNAGAGEPNLGAVTDKNLGTSLISDHDAITVISSSDNDNHWLIAQFGSTFVLGAIDNEPPFSIPNSFNDPNIEAANFAFNPTFNFLSVVPKNPDTNIKIYSINPSNGSFAVVDTIQNSARPGELMYDAAWSPNGEILYFSRNSTGNTTTGQIYHYHAGLQNPQPVLAEPVYRSYGLQTGPDGRLYHLYMEANDNIYRLGRIENPDSLTDLIYTAWQGNINFNGRQFPQFTPQEDFEFTLVEFEAVDTCVFNTTKFIGYVEPAYDSLVWTIGGTTINAISPELTFEESGPVTVTLTAWLNGMDSAVTRDITINENFQISLPSNDTTVCQEVFPEFGGPGLPFEATVEGGGSVDFFWSNSQTPETPDAATTFDSTGTYYVTAVHPTTGCVAYASVQIRICQEEKRVGNVWFFGDMAGIDFNPEEPQPLPDSSVMVAPAGASVISDRNGEVLFYTNGATVWNKFGDIMPNGENLGGDPNASQSALIVPFPGDATKYYIFTTDAAGGPLKYSIVDIKGDGGKGVVEATSKGTSLFSRSTEKITAVEIGGTTWLLAHELGNTSFYAYSITENGIQKGIPIEAGSSHSSGAGYMKFSTDGSKVAAAVQDSPPFVELFKFNDSTDVSTDMLVDPVRIEFSGEQPYGVEFSPDNEKLYITTTTGLYQYHVNDSLSAEEILASKKTIPTNGSGSLGALQIGPNGQIYIAQEGVSEVLVINGPNTLETDTSHVAVSPFDLAGPASRRGLPNFVQSIMEPISDGDFEFTSQCEDEEVQFSAIERCNTDLFSWSMRDPNGNPVQLGNAGSASRDNIEFLHTFAEPGTYSVTLNISNPCNPPEDAVITKSVEIYAKPAKPGFAKDIGICDSDTVLTAGPSNDKYSYYWYPYGQTTNEITIPKPSGQPVLYTVTITDTLTGCWTRDTTLILNAGPLVELGEDLFFCQGDTEIRLDAENPGAVYQWEVIDQENGTSIRSYSRNPITVSTATPGEFKYRVTVTNAFNCSTTDSVMVNVAALPSGVLNDGIVTSCGAMDGELRLNITSNGNYSYDAFDSDNNLIGFRRSIDGIESNIFVADGLGAGAYYLILTDNNGCEQRLEATIDAPGDPNQFDIFPASPVQANCSDLATIPITLSPEAVFPISLIINGRTSEGDPYFDNNPPITPPGMHTFGIQDVPTGTYILEVTDANGCVATADLQVDPAPAAVIDLEGFFVACENTTMSVTGNTTGFDFLWENIGAPDPSTGFTGVTNAATVGIDTSGTYRVTKTPQDPSICPSDTTFEIVINPAFSATYTTDEECVGESQVTIHVSNGSGNYAYEWSTGDRTNPLTVRTLGTHNYSVRVIDQGAARCATEIPVTVTVLPEVTVQLSTGPSCENEDQITLYANGAPDNAIFRWRNETLGEDVNQGIGLDSIIVTDEGTYSVVVSQSGCEATQSITVSRIPVGQSTLPETDVIICPSSSDPRRSNVTLYPDSLQGFNFDQYRWEVDGEPLSGEVRVGSRGEIMPQIPGLYTVTMINQGGCIVEDEVRVVQSCKPIIFVPNAIRPASGIGPNKAFQIFTEDGISDEGFQVYIFNRWGEILYQSRDPNFVWDGTFKGSPVPMEKYTYAIYYKGADDPSGEVYEIQGGVTVLR